MSPVEPAPPDQEEKGLSLGILAQRHSGDAAKAHGPGLQPRRTCFGPGCSATGLMCCVLSPTLGRRPYLLGSQLAQPRPLLVVAILCACVLG